MEAQALLDEAVRRTGLGNFGDESFLPSLERLVASYNEESDLSDFGQLAVLEMLVGSLVNRLKVESWYERHPEIADQEITAPLIIVGLPRTGSTLLSNLLALDPETRALRYWESENPCPPPEQDDSNDPRIPACQQKIDDKLSRQPELRDMLPFGAQAPNECHPLMYMSFHSISYEAMGNVPSYIDWLSEPGRDHLAAFDFHKRTLKLLQWRHGPRRWQLKSPGHSLMISAMAATYPDARYVMTHREPEKVMASVCSLVATVRADFLKSDRRYLLGPRLLADWSLRQRRLIDFRATAPADRFHDVYHQDTVRDGTATISKLYGEMGWAFRDELADAIKNWGSEHPKGEHKPSLNDFGLNEAMVRDAFSFYSGAMAQ